jgi:hypothetical protein
MMLVEVRGAERERFPPGAEPLVEARLHHEGSGQILAHAIGCS